MIKIRLIKDTAHYKVGEVINRNEKEAKEIVSQGYAEYVIEEVKEEQIRFYVDRSAELKAKCPSVDILIEKHVFPKLKYYEEHPDKFEKRADNEGRVPVFLQEIKQTVYIKDNKPKEDKEKLKDEIRKEVIEEIKQGNPTPEILEILKNPDLFKEITENEFDKKIVGELETRKVIFLCGAGGRLVENCQIASFNLLVNDDAGTGKDYITGNVLDILPKECYIHKTRISPTVFTYWHNPTYESGFTWNGKVFYPEDISEQVLNSDVFKVMCSKGSSATIVIRQRAIEIDIVGKPIMITTTATATPSPELTRRFVILNLDSSETQTRAIMKRHSEFKKRGIVPEYNIKYTEAMKCLKRVKVKIPFADLIDEYFPQKNIVMRTNYPRFLDFISASAGFYQFQREKDNEGYILAQGQDYDIARDCFLKLCSNKYMISLTINQKKILEIYENEPCIKGSASTLHSSKMNFLSLPALLTNLGLLVKYGFLETEIEKDSWNRDIEVYSISKSYNPNEKIIIPTSEELGINALIPLEPKIPLEPLEPLTPNKESEVGIKDIKGIKPKKALDNDSFSTESLNKALGVENAG